MSKCVPFRTAVSGMRRSVELGQLQGKIEQEITLLDLSAAAADTFFTQT